MSKGVLIVIALPFLMHDLDFLDLNVMTSAPSPPIGSCIPDKN